MTCSLAERVRTRSSPPPPPGRSAGMACRALSRRLSSACLNRFVSRRHWGFSGARAVSTRTLLACACGCTKSSSSSTSALIDTGSSRSSIRPAKRRKSSSVWRRRSASFLSVANRVSERHACWENGEIFLHQLQVQLQGRERVFKFVGQARRQLSHLRQLVQAGDAVVLASEAAGALGLVLSALQCVPGWTPWFHDAARSFGKCRKNHQDTKTPRKYRKLKLL